jgi:hypothetical protein
MCLMASFNIKIELLTYQLFRLTEVGADILAVIILNRGLGTCRELDGFKARMNLGKFLNIDVTKRYKKGNV